MAKTLNSLLFLRRVLTAAAAENVKLHPTAPELRKAAADSGKEVFWMRDPKTDNWIPETHFGEIDVAELRKKLLPNKSRPLTKQE